MRRHSAGGVVSGLELSGTGRSMVFVLLTAHLSPERRERVRTRLQTNLMAWLTTVSSAGKPDTVPVWFLVRDETNSVLLYSRPGKRKLSNIATNPNVALGLDVTDIGRDIFRIEGTAKVVADHPRA